MRVALNRVILYVQDVDRLPLAELRAELIAKGAPMREIKSCPGLTGLLCDGEDPEGNVFQLAEAIPAVRPG